MMVLNRLDQRTVLSVIAKTRPSVTGNTPAATVQMMVFCNDTTKWASVNNSMKFDNPTKTAGVILSSWVRPGWEKLRRDERAGASSLLLLGRPDLISQGLQVLFDLVGSVRMHHE